MKPLLLLLVVPLTAHASWFTLEAGAGVSHDLLSRYESDECLPALRNAIRIARALDCSLDWLCCVDEPES